MNNTLEVDSKISAVRRVVGIQASATGEAPTKIELVPSGRWMGSWKGDLEITIGDLMEMKANFDAGKGLPGGGSAGAPIDYAHEDWEKAAAWIKEVEVEGGMLVATVIEWTKAAVEAIKDGEWKFISPSFYPACMGMWCDPEDPNITARNVLMGAGLTNIPFFKGLSGLKASQSSNNEGGKDDTIYISKQIKGDHSMDLVAIRAKAPNEITADEKAFLKENRSELTADEEAAFNLDDKPAVAPVVDASVSADAQEAAKIQASIKAGTHKLVSVDEFNSIKASVEANAKTIEGFEKEKIEASVKTHIARGAIKADQLETWTSKIMADRSLGDMLTALPDNQILASEIGDSNAGAAKMASVEIMDKANALVTASNGSLNIGDAISKVRRENVELAKRYDEEAKA